MPDAPRATRPGVRRASRPVDRYTPISNDFARSRLSPRAKVVALYLLSHAEGFVVTQARIAREIGLGVTTVAEALTDLEAAGLLQRHPVRGPNGHTVGTEYVVSDTPLTPESNDRVDPTRTVDSGDLESRSPESTDHKKNTSKKKTSKNEKTNPPGGDASAAPVEADSPEPPGPQAVVAAYVDAFRANHAGNDPVRSVIAQVGREAKTLLDQFPAAVVMAAARDLGQTAWRSLERQVMMAAEAQRAGAQRPDQAGLQAAERDRYWSQEQAAHPERFSTPIDQRALEDWLAERGGKAF